MVCAEDFERTRKFVEAAQLFRLLDHVGSQVDPLSFVAFECCQRLLRARLGRKDVRIELAPVDGVLHWRRLEPTAFVPIERVLLRCDTMRCRLVVLLAIVRVVMIHFVIVHNFTQLCYLITNPGNWCIKFALAASNRFRSRSVIQAIAAFMPVMVFRSH